MRRLEEDLNENSSTITNLCQPLQMKYRAEQTTADDTVQPIPLLHGDQFCRTCAQLCHLKSERRLCNISVIPNPPAKTSINFASAIKNQSLLHLVVALVLLWECERESGWEHWHTIWHGGEVHREWYHVRITIRT